MFRGVEGGGHAELVVICHLRPSLAPGGFAGVDVFFVISGFLDARSGDRSPVRTLPPVGAAVLRDLVTSIHPDVVITSDMDGMGSLADPQAGTRAYADIAAGMARY